MQKLIGSRFQVLDYLDAAFSDIRAVGDYWESLCDGRFAPPWKHVDLTTIAPKTLPRICVVDVTHDPLDFVYRYWGTAITKMHKRDATRQSIRTVPPADYGAVLVRQYEMVYADKKPKTFVCEFEGVSHVISQYVVRRMPLSDDGTHVTGVISIEEYGSDQKDLSQLFETVAQSAWAV